MKVVAKALIIDKEENLLILSRGLTHPHFPNHYDLPGGEVEEGEAWNVAVAREILEETGISINSDKLDMVFEIQHPTVIHTLFIAKVNTKLPKVTLSWEHRKHQWLKVKDILNTQLPKGVDKYYTDVIEHLKVHPDL